MKAALFGFCVLAVVMALFFQCEPGFVVAFETAQIAVAPKMINKE